MLGFSFEQFAVLAVVCILVLGPQKSFELANFLGHMIGNLKKKWDEIRRQIELPDTGTASKIAQDLKAEFSAKNLNTNIKKAIHNSVSNKEAKQEQGVQDDQAVQNVANVTEQNVANVTEKNVTSQEAIYCKKTIQDDYAQVSCLSCAELNAQFLSMKVSMQEEIARMQKELAELKAQKTLKDDPRVGTRDELTIS